MYYIVFIFEKRHDEIEILQTENNGNNRVFFLMAPYFLWNTRFFYKQHFYKQRQAEICKELSKRLATPWGWTFDKHVQKTSLSVSMRLYD